MPFTLSHPAAIIPLARSKLILSALVIGSMSPDFLYFINLAPRGQFGHTIPGVFLFCLPLGMLVLWIFHALLKWPILSLLPKALQERLIGPAKSFSLMPIARQLLVVVSLLIGAFTHIFWDGFTHEYGWAVSLLPFLNRPVIKFGAKTIPLFKLLQHSSTAVGSGLLLICLTHWLSRAPKEELSRELYRSAIHKLSWGVALLIVAAILGSLSSWWRVAQMSNQRGLSSWLSCFVIGALSGLFVELTLFGLYWRYSKGSDMASSGS